MRLRLVIIALALLISPATPAAANVFKLADFETISNSINNAARLRRDILNAEKNSRDDNDKDCLLELISKYVGS